MLMTTSHMTGLQCFIRWWPFPLGSLTLVRGRTGQTPSSSHTQSSGRRRVQPEWPSLTQLLDTEFHELFQEGEFVVHSAAHGGPVLVRAFPYLIVGDSVARAQFTGVLQPSPMGRHAASFVDWVGRGECVGISGRKRRSIVTWMRQDAFMLLFRQMGVWQIGQSHCTGHPVCGIGRTLIPFASRESILCTWRELVCYMRTLNFWNSPRRNSRGFLHRPSLFLGSWEGNSRLQSAHLASSSN